MEISTYFDLPQNPQQGYSGEETNFFTKKAMWNVKRSCSKAFIICLPSCVMLWNVESNDFNCCCKRFSLVNDYAKDGGEELFTNMH